MHATDSPQQFPPPRPFVRTSRFQEGFSLVEVTMAIGIIAFAFVALFGLLPSGLTTFRAAVDTTNDSSIMQDMNSMVQVTPWAEIDKLDSKSSNEIYYYDEEGRRTDTKVNQSNKDVVKERRLYQVKLLVEPCGQPGSSSSSGANELEHARRIVVVIGDLGRPKSETDFESVKKAEDLAKPGGQLEVRSRTFIVTRMESQI